MTEEKLFSKETFIELLNKNEIDRIDYEDKLFLEAKKLGLEKRFKESLKKYEALMKNKIQFDNSLKLPKCKYNIENYKMGNYSCTVNGITDKTNVKFSYIPVLPVERYVNEDTGKEKVKIIYFKENEWKEKIVDKSQLSISQKLLLLSDDGLDVTSENVKYYINYFNEIMNINDIKKLSSISHIGWKDDLFVPYDTHGIFDGADDFRNIYKAIGSKGNYEKWKNCIAELREHKVIKLLMATTLASPLLEKLNLQPYMVNLWSSLSGNGKTLSCMVAMSIWGNPDVGALRLSSNNTQNYYSVVASFMRNITCYFDELQIVKRSKYLDLESLVMDLCNGTEKGRLNKNSQAKEIKIWYNNFLFTSNDKLVKENAGEQVYNRVIDLEIGEKIIQDGQKIAKIIKENYGFAGKEYIKYIKTVGFDTIFERFENIFKRILKETKATDKQAASLASILLANELANECIFNDDYILQVKDIIEYVNDKDEIKTAIKARDYIIGIINANYKKFDTNNYGECWGFKNEYFCTFNAQILYRELLKGGFEFDTVKSDWANIGFLEKNSQGKYVHQTTVRSESGSYVRLKISQKDKILT
nr:MAG TPA: active helicase ring shaped helicase [Caudoviricetes sp.]